MILGAEAPALAPAPPPALAPRPKAAPSISPGLVGAAVLELGVVVLVDRREHPLAWWLAFGLLAFDSARLVSAVAKAKHL